MENPNLKLKVLLREHGLINISKLQLPREQKNTKKAVSSVSSTSTLSEDYDSAPDYYPNDDYNDPDFDSGSDDIDAPHTQPRKETPNTNDEQVEEVEQVAELLIYFKKKTVGSASITPTRNPPTNDNLNLLEPHSQASKLRPKT